jgi:hypothetical protein
MPYGPSATAWSSAASARKSGAESQRRPGPLPAEGQTQVRQSRRGEAAPTSAALPSPWRGRTSALTPSQGRSRHRRPAAAERRLNTPSRTHGLWSRGTARLGARAGSGRDLSSARYSRQPEWTPVSGSRHPPAPAATTPAGASYQVTVQQAGLAREQARSAQAGEGQGGSNPYYAAGVLQESANRMDPGASAAATASAAQLGTSSSTWSRGP